MGHAKKIRKRKMYFKKHKKIRNAYWYLYYKLYFKGMQIYRDQMHRELLKKVFTNKERPKLSLLDIQNIVFSDPNKYELYDPLKSKKG
jgi:hypothetical protein